ncbi:pepSY-associated TM helix family protein [Anoxybacillus amylolyticus]|uniref:PepSY-associated TM helix family protein n=2 Tax=Anoxybacteroides amylolyticum TaxID=294699 RepID=A0A160F1K4_9BACL|nr:PepSY-associated TM helix domain-containing protein [Anoxybacillus amylolyticus]ANB60036.1 pepSY-associated TM helix family protein [Anoxybacillus amylolyticus]
MRKMRNVHLWIGLITSLFLFIEAGTGLLLTERWLMGSSSGHGQHSEHSSGHGEHLSMMDAVKKASESGAFDWNDVSVVMNHGVYMVKLNDDAGTMVTISPDGTVISKEANKFASIVRGLHVGQVGDMNIKWMLDVASISILVLTGTGIYLSVKILRAQSKKKRKSLVV